MSTDSLPRLVEELIEQPGIAILAPVNIDILNKAAADADLLQFLRDADVVYSDGSGPVLGSWILGDRLPPRVTSIRLLHALCRRWTDGRYSLYFLGGPPGVNEKAVDVLTGLYPGVRIVGTHRGHLSPDEELDVVARINELKPDVVCVGFGTPYQERFIIDHADRLIGAPLLWPVGALTTHIAGLVPRAPRWMRRSGLEWLHRLSLEPRRLWRRYLIGNPQFVAAVIAERLSGK